MSVKIKNLTNRTVLLRLNSGHTLHLAPGSISSSIIMQEINGNAKFKKLVNLNVISSFKEEVKDEKKVPLKIEEKELPQKDKKKEEVKKSEKKIKVIKTKKEDNK